MKVRGASKRAQRACDASRSTAGLGLPMLEKLTDRHPDVSANLSKQDRRDIAALMKRNGRSLASAIAKLLMRTALPDFNEAELQKYCDNFGRFENGNVAHVLGNSNVLDPDKLRVESWLSVFEKH
jgi:hypothetical protein